MFFCVCTLKMTDWRDMKCHLLIRLERHECHLLISFTWCNCKQNFLAECSKFVEVEGTHLYLASLKCFFVFFTFTCSSVILCLLLLFSPILSVSFCFLLLYFFVVVVFGVVVCLFVGLFFCCFFFFGRGQESRIIGLSLYSFSFSSAYIKPPFFWLLLC